VKPAAVDVKMDVSRLKVRRDGFPDLHILVSSPSTKNWNFKSTTVSISMRSSILFPIWT
jgi:hypothetical protein